MKFCNVNIFYKSSLRQFHSLMEEGIHDFCETLVLLKGTDIFLFYFSEGNLKFHDLKKELNLVYIKVQHHYLAYT